MSKLKKIFRSPRILMMFIMIILLITAIHYNPFREGAAIRNVAVNSSAGIAGILNPKPTSTPMSREVITAINNRPVKTLNDYYTLTSGLRINQSLQIKTNKGLYRLIVKEAFEAVELNETEIIVVNQTVPVNKTINGTEMEVYEIQPVTKEVRKVNYVSKGPEDLGLSVYDAPQTNIRKGLDLQGGTRVLLQPEKKLQKDEVESLIANMKERLNVYGLSDLVIRDAGDLSGNQYILIEIAGATQQEVKDLLSKQGKFEAKIGDSTVFSGGSDITYVCRSADCAGIDPSAGCSQSGGQWLCRFRFSISTSKQAAERQAFLTKDLEIVGGEAGLRNAYLSKQIVLFLDDSPVDQLNIGADLKGKVVTDISISGSGSGATQQDAMVNALGNMKRLQTILITGSLPVKLNIVKTDTISPALGEEFVKNALFIGLAAMIAVLLVVYLRYRSFKIIVPMLINVGAEIISILGLAAIIGWNIDIAAVAGIIIAIGTGLNDVTIITDEVLEGETEEVALDWKKKLKSALAIIMAAFFTIVVAMIPLIFAGAGLLKGFAITTIIGISIGVFVTRPAYSKMIEIMLKE